MAIERTLSIIKPDGVEKNLIGEIYKRFEGAGLQIIGARMIQLSQEQAEGFYAVHKERPFYNDLVSYMMSGPVVVTALEGENAIEQNRTLMGATNPADAAAGTIRADYAASIEENVVHGSDAADTAAEEMRADIVSQAMYLIFILENGFSTELSQDALSDLFLAVFRYRQTLNAADARRISDNTIIMGDKGASIRRRD